MRSQHSSRRRHVRRDPFNEAILNVRTAGFLGRRLWRPTLYVAGSRLRQGTVRRLHLRAKR